MPQDSAWAVTGQMWLQVRRRPVSTARTGPLTCVCATCFRCASKGWANNACGQEWTKPFLLQITAEGGDPELVLIFRTLGGNVAASINWNCTVPPSGLPEAVLDGIRSSGFECPFEPLRLSNLRLLKPGGAPLDMSPDAAPLAEQLASVEP